MMTIALDAAPLFFAVFVFKNEDLPSPEKLKSTLESLQRPLLADDGDGIPHLLHVTIHIRDYQGATAEFGVSLADGTDDVGPMKMASSGLSLIVVDFQTATDVNPKFVRLRMLQAAAEMKDALHYELCKVKKL